MINFESRPQFTAEEPEQEEQEDFFGEALRLETEALAAIESPSDEKAGKDFAGVVKTLRALTAMVALFNPVRIDAQERTAYTDLEKEMQTIGSNIAVMVRNDNPLSAKHLEQYRKMSQEIANTPTTEALRTVSDPTERIKLNQEFRLRPRNFFWRDRDYFYHAKKNQWYFFTADKPGRQWVNFIRDNETGVVTDHLTGQTVFTPPEK